MGGFSSTSKLLDNNSVFSVFTVQEGKEEEEIQIGVRISMTTVHPYSLQMHIHVMHMNMIKTLTDLTNWLNVQKVNFCQ